MNFAFRRTAAALAALALTAFCAAPASAGVPADALNTPGTPTTSATQDNLPPALKSAVDSNKLKVVKSFPGPSGMVGWVIEPPRAKPTIVFTTGDGQVLVTGVLLDAEGKNLNTSYADKHVPKPDYQALGAQLEKFKVIGDGAKGRVTSKAGTLGTSMGMVGGTDGPESAGLA